MWVLRSLREATTPWRGLTMKTHDRAQRVWDWGRVLRATSELGGPGSIL